MISYNSETERWPINCRGVRYKWQQNYWPSFETSARFLFFSLFDPNQATKKVKREPSCNPSSTAKTTVLRCWMSGTTLRVALQQLLYVCSRLQFAAGDRTLFVVQHGAPLHVRLLPVTLFRSNRRHLLSLLLAEFFDATPTCGRPFAKTLVKLRKLFLSFKCPSIPPPPAMTELFVKPPHTPKMKGVGHNVLHHAAVNVPILKTIIFSRFATVHLTLQDYDRNANLTIMQGSSNLRTKKLQNCL